MIGNASSLLDQDYAEAIDSNYTIRLNLPEIEKHKDKLGSRRDAIFFEYPKIEARDILKVFYEAFHDKCTLILGHNFKEAEARAWLRVKKQMRLNKRTWLLSDTMNRKMMSGYDGQWPSAGFSVLFLLDHLGFNNVNIFGFDWKRTPTWYDAGAPKYPDERNIIAVHNFIFEEKVIKDMVKARMGWKIWK